MLWLCADFCDGDFVAWNLQYKTKANVYHAMCIYVCVCLCVCDCALAHVQVCAFLMQK
jgi:hypothetical protein